jgi:DNA invertase Pin-like site-specific DNA recombinase
MKVARIYLHVSTDEQDLGRQERIAVNAKTVGYDIAGIYREKASGARVDRPGGEVVIRCDRHPICLKELLADVILI